MLVSYTQVNTCNKLEETIHVHVRLFSQDSTFDLFSFQFFFQIWVAKLGVRLIYECSLYAGVYSKSIPETFLTVYHVLLEEEI